MPRQDKTGPMGKGPLTGRGLGSCTKESIGRGIGRGLGRGLGVGIAALGLGYGMRRGFRRFWQNQGSDAELTMLKEEANILNEKLEQINQRISVIEQEQEQDIQE